MHTISSTKIQAHYSRRNYYFQNQSNQILSSFTQILIPSVPIKVKMFKKMKSSVPAIMMFHAYVSSMTKHTFRQYMDEFSSVPKVNLRFFLCVFHQSVWLTESALIWSELSQAILSKDWEKAREAKKAVEERQRELLRERESKGETWVPKHFILSQSKEGIWDCSPIQKWVPASPIVTL